MAQFAAGARGILLQEITGKQMSVAWRTRVRKDADFFRFSESMGLAKKARRASANMAAARTTALLPPE